jgi:cytosine/adenosine deaminase-related metal-dependent hydrolase
VIVLRGGTVVTMDARRSVVQGDVLVAEGRVQEVGRVRARRGARVIECAGRAIIPGLVQAHVHLCQVLFRNHADGLELLDWLSQRIWPYEAAHDERSLGFSARLGILEAALEGGIRYTGGKCLMDEAADCPLHEETGLALEETIALGRKWHGRELIRWALCPRFVISCTEKLLGEVRRLSEREGWLVHTHASENRTEVELVRRKTGRDNIQYLDDLGLCGPRTVLAHCVHITESEMRILASTGTSAVHCPGANLKLASGHAPVPRLLAEGVNVALGGDGAPCNNTLDAFREMRLAATLHLPQFGPRSMPATEILAMATVRGAKALGLSEEIGSIEEGKRADLAVVDLMGPHCQPAGADPHATIVYCARASDVTDVLVDGRPVVRDRKLLTLDAPRLAAQAQGEVRRVLERVSPRPGN